MKKIINNNEKILRMCKIILIILQIIIKKLNCKRQNKIKSYIYNCNNINVFNLTALYPFSTLYHCLCLCLSFAIQALLTSYSSTHKQNNNDKRNKYLITNKIDLMIHILLNKTKYLFLSFFSFFIFHFLVCSKTVSYENYIIQI